MWDSWVLQSCLTWPFYLAGPAALGPQCSEARNRTRGDDKVTIPDLFSSSSLSVLAPRCLLSGPLTPFPGLGGSVRYYPLRFRHAQLLM